MIDAHHHLWDLQAVHYPWLMAKGEVRFFGDPAPIQRDFLIDEFRAMAAAKGITASVHIQVGAEDGIDEARWVQSVADANPDWPMAQVGFVDLTAPDALSRLDQLQALPSLRGVRQIVGRAPGEDARTGTNSLLDDPAFLTGLKAVAARGLSFDLQLIPELMGKMARLLAEVPELRVALCHAGSPYDRSDEGIASWAEQLSALSSLPQVTCKLSGLGMFDHHWTAESFAPVVAVCLEQFGPARCMVGSNFPVDSLYSDYGTLMDAFAQLIPVKDHRAVFEETARQFYKL